MADRAHYLARTLIARLRNLQTSFAEDGRGELDRDQRLAMIEKVLAVELGITDGSVMALIDSAMPTIRAGRSTSDEDVTTLADFLRKHLAAAL